MQEKTAAPGFPPNNFRHFLTLFSKFFASFPHGTCSLSVSHQYLALGDIYLQIRAALPSNPTLGKSQRSRTAALQAYHPLRAMATVKLDFDWPSTPREDSPKRHISRDREGLRFGDGLFPFHSPLLRESLLFSFPPLINMLKFGG